MSFDTHAPRRCSRMRQSSSCSVARRSIACCSNMHLLPCYDVVMPNINVNAKAFEKTLAGWFGNVVSRRRHALKMTASELSRRTAELGYPISRGAIAKIESSLRSGKVDVAEVLVLAAALDMPPVLLLFPQLGTDGGAVVIPGVYTRTGDAVRWVAGQLAFPQECDRSTMHLVGQPNPTNDGVRLIEAEALLEQALETRISLVRLSAPSSVKRSRSRHRPADVGKERRADRGLAHHDSGCARRPVGMGIEPWEESDGGVEDASDEQADESDD